MSQDHVKPMREGAVSEVILTHDEIGKIDQLPLGHLSGVTHTRLWSDATSHAGVLDIAGGASIPEHTHDGHAHHVWIVRGRAEVRGRVLGAGSYAYVPPGISHALTGLRPEGCKIFYIFQAS
jgi:anti-sigma factor ChrR (cupin superfamily)